MANNEQDLLWVYNPTKTAFTVHWGGVPHTLQSGEKQVMARFVAEHFAKHLADAILLRKEQNEFEKTQKMKPYVMHPVERPKVIDLILIGVYRYYQGAPTDPNAAIAHMVNEVNKSPTQDAPLAPQDNTVYEDYGLVPDRALGMIPDAPATPGQTTAPAVTADDGGAAGELLGAEESPADAPDGVTGNDPAKPKRSREELLEEAERLGIEVKPKTPTHQIERMIKAF